MADTFSAYYARRVVRQKLAQDINNALRSSAPAAPSEGFNDVNPTLPGEDLGGYDEFNLPEDPQQATTGDATTGFNDAGPGVSGPRLRLRAPWPEKSKVCIIGAGVTGLYIAMILNSLQLPGLSYEILEGSDRIGGRMLTHYFSKTSHDYYDIGAMRFPGLDIMKRTFDLFKKLQIPLRTYYLDEGSKMTPTMFNDICTINGVSEQKFDPYRVSVEQPEGKVPINAVDASKALNDAFDEFKSIMAVDFEKGYEALMKYDHMSTRQYLRDVKKFDSYAIQWLETNGTSTNLFDQALSESVIDSFDFDPPLTPKDDVNSPKKDKFQWWCINGGTSLVTEAMAREISRADGRIETSKRVSKIEQLADDNLWISVAGEPEPRGPYSTVFNTTSLGCLGRMDLRSLDLHPVQKDAIRSLHYDDSAKVAIKFSYPWWITECGITSGGAGSTDLPLRTCVYPSYNLNDGANNPAILLCSYTWAQDALRVGSLIYPNSPCKEEAQLMDLMFDNLARLHLDNFNHQSKTTLSLEDVRAKIEKAYITHHAFSWSHDPYTSGAFALFGPSQFKDIYPYLTRPAARSRFHILGEHSSAHHAWIVGSLESAYSGVYKFLDNFGMFDYQKKMKDLWGEIPEFKDETGSKGSVWLQVALGDPKSLFGDAEKPKHNGIAVQ